MPRSGCRGDGPAVPARPQPPGGASGRSGGSAVPGNGTLGAVPGTHCGRWPAGCTVRPGGCRMKKSWMEHAACCTPAVDPELFFPVSDSGSAAPQIAAAKAVCTQCPVVGDCLAWALGGGARRHLGRHHAGRTPWAAPGAPAGRCCPPARCASAVAGRHAGKRLRLLSHHLRPAGHSSRASRPRATQQPRVPVQRARGHTPFKEDQMTGPSRATTDQGTPPTACGCGKADHRRWRGSLSARDSLTPACG
jgi:hypothetical protein